MAAANETSEYGIARTSIFELFSLSLSLSFSLSVSRFHRLASLWWRESESETTRWQSQITQRYVRGCLALEVEGNHPTRIDTYQ